MRRSLVLPLSVAALVTPTFTAVVGAGAEPTPAWTLSLVVTKTVEGEGLAEFVAADPLWRFLLDRPIYEMTATCGASDATAETSGEVGSQTDGAEPTIDLPGAGSEGSATVTVGAGAQATIEITVEDAADVDAVGCVVVETPLVLPTVAPGVDCTVAYEPASDVVFTADGQTRTVDVVNHCRPGEALETTPPPPVTTPPRLAG